MRTRSLIPAAVLSFGCSLHHRPVAPEPARGPARDSLFQLDQTRADSVASRGPVEGMLALLAPDVAYLRAGVPTVFGRDAARLLFAASARSSATTVSWQPLGGGVSDDLRSAYTFGVTARITPARPELRPERYVAYWERTREQPWRIVAYVEVNGPTAIEVSPTRQQVAAPVRALPKPMADAAATVRATDSLFSDLADRMGTAFAFSNTVDPYGAVFGTPQLVIGPKAVEEFYAAQGNGTSLTWHPVYASVAGSLDLGFTLGDYSVTSRGASGAAVQRFGKYLTVWKRQRDGTWKFVIDGGNGTPARAQ
jgi:ketosteroid isomerase-like protein